MQGRTRQYITILGEIISKNPTRGQNTWQNIRTDGKMSGWDNDKAGVRQEEKEKERGYNPLKGRYEKDNKLMTEMMTARRERGIGATVRETEAK